MGTETNQIIPFYAQPHTHTVIIDRTQYDETVATPVSGDDLPFATLVVTGSDSGIDNVLVPLTEKTEKESIFGKANFSKYGQASIQADVHFNGSTKVWFCRALPDNATFANLILLVNFRKGKVLNELGQETGLHRLEVRFSTGYANKPYVTEGATSDNVIATVARSMSKMTADPQTGLLTLPMFYARPAGRGRYGNDYAISMGRDVEAENDYGVKMYKFNLISNKTITRIMKSFTGSLFQTTRYDMSTLISDVLDQYDTGKCPISITPFEESFETLYEFYQSIVAENAQYLKASGGDDESLAELTAAQAITIDMFDPLFGLSMNTRTNETIPYYQNYTKRDDEWVAPDLTVPGTQAAAGDDWVSPVPPDGPNGPGSSSVSPDGTIGEGEVDLDEEEEKDLNRYGKPTTIKYWNAAAVGARVLVIADPDNDGMRMMYTVVSIDPETGAINYDEGEPVAIDADQYTGIKLSQDVGHVLSGGHDGDFQEITVDGVTRAPTSAEMKLLLSREYVKIFRGTRDRKILSPARVNLDFIMDANYNMTSGTLETSGPVDIFSGNSVLTDADHQALSVIGGSAITMDFDDLNVKKAIYDLNEFRNKNGMTINPDMGAGCSIYMDCNLTGLKSTVVNYELLNAIRQMEKLSGRATSIDLGYYEIFDPVSKKRIKVTATYKLAKTLVPHMLQYGINKPLTNKFCRMQALQKDKALMATGEMIRDSFRPTLDIIDWDVKEALYKSRINYWIVGRDGKTVSRHTQNTRQLDASCLLEENNVRVLNLLKKELEAACNDYLYEWNKPEARKGYTTAQMDRFRPWIGTVVEDLDIKFEANQFEQERMIMHCYCVVKFIDIVKRVILEINIQRPEYQLESE